MTTLIFDWKNRCAYADRCVTTTMTESYLSFKIKDILSGNLIKRNEKLLYREYTHHKLVQANGYLLGGSGSSMQISNIIGSILTFGLADTLKRKDFVPINSVYGAVLVMSEEEDCEIEFKGKAGKPLKMKKIPIATTHYQRSIRGSGLDAISKYKNWRDYNLNTLIRIAQYLDPYTGQEFEIRQLK